MDNPIGKGLEFYGKFQVYTGLVFAILICISLTYSGSYVIRTKPKFIHSTLATATNVACTANTCSVVATISVNGNAYTSTLTYPAPVATGSQVKVYYTDDKPPQFSSVTDDVPKGMGYGLIACGVCIVIIAMIMAYLVSSSQTAAQVFGATGALSQFSR